MAKISDTQIAAILSQEVSRAAGSDLSGGPLTANRQDATDYALGRKGGGDPPPGTSAYVSHDVGDAADAILGEILPSFKGDVVARFEENGPNDQTASLESDVVAEFIMDRNPGVVQLHNAIWDILHYKNGFMKCWVEEVTDTDVKEFQTDGAAVMAMAQGEADGFEMSRSGTTVTARRRRQHLKIEHVETERFLYAANHRSLDLADIRFCGELVFPTRSDLLGMGVKRSLVKDLAPAGPEYKADMTAKRVDGQSAWNDSQTADAQEIRCIACYRRMPADLNDSSLESELWWFLYALDSNRVLLKERAEMVNYVAGAAWVIPGRVEGMSVFDKLKPIADAKSDAIRLILENMRASNNCKTAHNDRVDPDDVLNQRSGATISVDGAGPVSDAVMQLGPQPFVGEGLAFIQYLDSVRTERVGASLDIAAPEFQVAGDTAHGTERMMSAREVRSGKNATMIAETLVRSLWLLVHKTLRRQWQGPVMANQSGEWVEVNPAEWPERDRVNITAGTSPGERIRKGQALGVIAANHEKLGAAGLTGVLTDTKRVYNVAVDQARAMGLDAPERYYVDPESESAKAAAEAVAEQAKAAADQASQLQEAMLRLEGMDRHLKRLEINFDYFKAELDSDTDLAVAGVQSVTAIESANANTEADRANGQERS